MVSFEPAEPDDAPGLKRTLAAAFEGASVEDFGVEGVLPPGGADGSMVDEAFEGQTMYAARDGGAVVGGIIVEPREGGEMYLQTLWVDPGRQRGGVGSRALGFLEDEHSDATAWTLETPKRSERNRRFYEQHGYEVGAEEAVEGADVVLLTYRKEPA